MANFILSKKKALEQYNSLQNISKVSYSFKTNPIVGEILEKETSCMFSVHFINELKLIKDKSRVWFLAQALNTDLLDRLFSFGVNKFVIENTEDLEALTSYISEHKKKIKLFLRMKLKENTVKTEKYYVFGIESNIVNKLIPELKKNQFIESVGIHVHRKTQNVSEWDLVRELSELITEESFKNIDCLNIGGGLPVMYKNITDKIVPSVMAKLIDLKKWLEQKNVVLMIEPGRYICGPAITLETTVVGVHGNTIVVDASVYNSSPDTLIVPIKLLVEGEVDEDLGRGKAYVIKGITPCSTDIFRYRVYFPEKQTFKAGDKIKFLNAGAYNFHTTFCELDKVETEIVD